MLPDTNRDEHWHTAFSIFTCHSICSSLRWICALKIHSATRRLQWSRRETVEARGTKWNFDVEMDSGIVGSLVASRPDEGMPTATTQEEIPTVRPPAPPPEEHVPEMLGQGVQAK